MRIEDRVTWPLESFTSIPSWESVSRKFLRKRPFPQPCVPNLTFF